MKRILAVLLAVCMIASSVAMLAFAEGEPSAEVWTKHTIFDATLYNHDGTQPDLSGGFSDGQCIGDYQLWTGGHLYQSKGLNVFNGAYIEITFVGTAFKLPVKFRDMNVPDASNVIITVDGEDKSAGLKDFKAADFNGDHVKETTIFEIHNLDIAHEHTVKIQVNGGVRFNIDAYAVENENYDMYLDFGVNSDFEGEYLCEGSAPVVTEGGDTFRKIEGSGYVLYEIYLPEADGMPVKTVGARISMPVEGFYVVSASASEDGPFTVLREAGDVDTGYTNNRYKPRVEYIDLTPVLEGNDGYVYVKVTCQEGKDWAGIWCKDQAPARLKKYVNREYNLAHGADKDNGPHPVNDTAVGEIYDGYNGEIFFVVAVEELPASTITVNRAEYSDEFDYGYEVEYTVENVGDLDGDAWIGIYPVSLLEDVLNGQNVFSGNSYGSWCRVSLAGNHESALEQGTYEVNHTDGEWGDFVINETDLLDLETEYVAVLFECDANGYKLINFSDAFTFEDVTPEETEPEETEPEETEPEETEPEETEPEETEPEETEPKETDPKETAPAETDAPVVPTPTGDVFLAVAAAVIAVAAGIVLTKKH